LIAAAIASGRKLRRQRVRTEAIIARRAAQEARERVRRVGLRVETRLVDVADFTRLQA
jgi:hypothetical protein